MTIEQLAAHDAADRLRILDDGIARRRAAVDGIERAGGRTDAIRANLARLEARRAELVTRGQTLRVLAVATLAVLLPAVIR